MNQAQLFTPTPSQLNHRQVASPSFYAKGMSSVPETSPNSVMQDTFVRQAKPNHSSPMSLQSHAQSLGGRTLMFGQCINAATRAEQITNMLLANSRSRRLHAMASASQKGNGSVNAVNTILALLAGKDKAGEYLDGKALTEIEANGEDWDHLLKDGKEGRKLSNWALLALVNMLNNDLSENSELKEKAKALLKKILASGGRGPYGHLDKEMVREALNKLENKETASSQRWEQVESAAADNANHVHG